MGVLLGKFFNPDQDAWNKLGILEGALGLDVFRRELPHRSRASHTIGISGLLLFTPVIAVLIIIAYSIGLTAYPLFWKGMVWATLGLLVDNTAHIVSDRLQSFWKYKILGRKVKR